MKQAISDVASDLQGNQTRILSLSKIMDKLRHKYARSNKDIDKSCTEVLETEFNLSEDKLNETVAAIRNFSLHLNPSIDIGDIASAKNQLYKASSLNSNIKHMMLANENESKKIIQANFHKAQFQRYEASKQLINLNDLNSEVIEQNIEVNNFFFNFL